MSIRDTLKESMKSAMREKKQLALSTVRLVLAAIKDRDIAKRTDGKNGQLSDDEILSLLQSMIKQRRDSIKMFEQGGRVELAEREQNEISVIESFLPKQMDEDEIRAAVAKVIEDTGASSVKDMGQAMGALKSHYAGQMDFSKASGIVKEILMAKAG